jgi:amino acid transporter/mannitol/fructose-specific phosphotransferase system IIA component (Ntr-type)
MAVLAPSKRLKKDLTLLNVYAISVGATLSSGFFLLPGLAAREAGPAVVLTYLIALLPLIPGILSKVELSTAMPRAGGVYYFLDRSIGPAFGTIGGIGTWLALVLKVAFALVGMGAYLGVFWPAHWPDLPIKWIAAGFALAFGLLNLLGAKKTSGFQVVLVVGLLVLLVWFLVAGVPEVRRPHFDGFFDKGHRAILSTAGLVCISYIGLSKVASVSEEVKDPERNLPLGMFLALGTSIVVYVLGTIVVVGVEPPGMLYLGAEPDLRPIATTAGILVPRGGAVVMSIAAILAFFSVANAGILSASRYPLAMSRDQLMPSAFDSLGRTGTPIKAIVVTTAMVVVSVVALDPLNIAKLAGAFQLLLFALNCLAVIIMRESRIQSYDPGYRSPFYPWLQIFGTIAPFVLIAEMGWLPCLFTAGLIAVGSLWYVAYGRKRVTRRGAIDHVFRRLARLESADDVLDRELRGILKEKGLRDNDPFDESVLHADVLDVAPGRDFEQIVHEATRRLASRVPYEQESLARGFLEGTRTGLTPVSGGVALPHLRLADLDVPHLVIARSREPLRIPVGDALGHTRTHEDTHAIFFLVSPEEDPGQHLRLLAQLASRVDEDGFMAQWLDAADALEIKEILLRNDRFLSIVVTAGEPSGAMIDRPIREMDLPEGSLVAAIHRGGRAIVPRGDTVILERDRLTCIGHERAIAALRSRLVKDRDSAD